MCWAHVEQEARQLLSGRFAREHQHPPARLVQRFKGPLEHYPADFFGQPYAGDVDFTLTALTDAELCVFPRPAFRIGLAEEIGRIEQPDRLLAPVGGGCGQLQDA
jgi:CRP-like cAMP-binding protein